jgi:hypothetical protein
MQGSYRSERSMDVESISRKLSFQWLEAVYWIVMLRGGGVNGQVGHDQPSVRIEMVGRVRASILIISAAREGAATMSRAIRIPPAKHTRSRSSDRKFGRIWGAAFGSAEQICIVPLLSGRMGDGPKVIPGWGSRTRFTGSLKVASAIVY